MAPAGDAIHAVAGRALKPPVQKTIASIARADVRDNALVIKLAARQARCELTKTFFGEAGPGTPPSGASNDPDAQAFWLGNGGKKGKEEMKRVRDAGGKLGLPSDVQFLVHLPSGNRIFPSPAAVTEGVPLQIAVLLDKDDRRALSATLDNCEAVDTARVVMGKAATPDKQAGEYVLRPVDAYFRCGAGTIKYHLAVAPVASAGVDKAERPGAGKAGGSGGAAGQDASGVSATDGQTAKDAATSDNEGRAFMLRVRPKYHFAGIVALGYDWGKRPTFETKPDSAGGTATIARIDNTVGTIGYVGAQWMIGGVDYEEMRWYNYFANPFLAVNVSSPTNDAVAGLALTPTGGVSFAVGVGLHIGRRLKNGLREGDPFTGTGDIPTTDTWSGVHPGLFLGLAVDTRVSDAVGNKFGGSSSGK